MRVPIESIQYLVDVFIEGGYAEEEDLDHLDAIYMWLREEEDFQRRAFQKRITRDVNPDYPSKKEVLTEYVPLTGGWMVEPHQFEDPADMPVNRDGEDGPLDDENPPESRATYTIVDT